MFDIIKKLFQEKGSNQYMIGEPITQEQHALQSFSYMLTNGHPVHLQIAALLHDIGHFIPETSINPIETKIDDKHEYLGASWLMTHGFPKSVYLPVMLHVTAKRYMCTIDKDYFNTLSPASQESFMLQGGKMSEEEIETFRKSLYFNDALILRMADDSAKKTTNCTFSLDDVEYLFR